MNIDRNNTIIVYSRGSTGKQATLHFNSKKFYNHHIHRSAVRRRKHATYKQDIDKTKNYKEHK